jgi:C_GCAxxG_C_C family probable redox protein
MGRGNCGAYSGGVLALGLKYGRERKDFGEKEKTKKASQLARKLHEKFMDEYGGCSCHDVQMNIFGRTFNLQNPEDRREFEKAGAHVDKCPKVVAKAAQWTGEIILNEESKNT